MYKERKEITNVEIGEEDIHHHHTSSSSSSSYIYIYIYISKISIMYVKIVTRLVYKKLTNDARISVRD